MHISKNGARLAQALEKLVAQWPVPVEKVVFVGHSMGGLVSRVACAEAAKKHYVWANKATTVICLGSPHLGAPLEKGTHVVDTVLDAFALTRPLSKALRSRAVGIKDLRFGATDDTDWRGRDSDEWWNGRRLPIARLPHVRYYFAGATLGKSFDDIKGKLIGDGLVRIPSSTAQIVADADTAVVFSLNHMQLLNHPAVWYLIEGWLKNKR